jgi:hypothetical protein
VKPDGPGCGKDGLNLDELGAIFRSGGLDQAVAEKIREGWRSQSRKVIPGAWEGRSRHGKDISVTWEERNAKTAR